MHFSGSIVPMITPFGMKGEIDFDTFGQLLERQLSEGTHCISVCGTTGEPSSLSIEERKEIIQNTVEKVDGRGPVIAGTGSANFEETDALTRFAEEAGADGVLVIVPYYVRPSQEALYAYFGRIASSVSIPLVIYNIPGRAAAEIEPSTVARLKREFSNVTGIKDSVKDMDHVTALLQECGRDFAVYSGTETLCLPVLAVGGAGFFSAAANLFPRQLSDLYSRYKEGRMKEALDMHHRLFQFNRALFWETNPVPLKYAMSLSGLCRNSVRLPLVPLSDENRVRMRRLLTGYGLEVKEE